MEFVFARKEFFHTIMVLASLIISLMVSCTRGDDGVWLGPEVGHTCSHAEQLNLTMMFGMHDCASRGPQDEVVQLALPNSSYSHIVPNFVIAKRCAGSCNRYNRHVSCIPDAVGIREVEVFLMPSSAEAGSHAAICAKAQVEEHISCRCGCKVTEDDCRRSRLVGGGGPKRFVEPECKCECENIDDRQPCLQSGNFWDDRECACFCKPQHEWPHCPSGYAFDHSPGTCACVSYNINAAFVIYVLLVILVLATAKISFSLVQCYKSRTGLFRPAHHQHQARQQQEDSSRIRDLFRQLTTESQVSRPRFSVNQDEEESSPVMSQVRSVMKRICLKSPRPTEATSIREPEISNQADLSRPILRSGNHLYASIHQHRNLSVSSGSSKDCQSISTDCSNASSEH